MIKEAIQAVVDGQSLSMDEAAQVMREIMEGQVTPSQFGAFVTALRIKGETVEEIAGLAKIMREKAIRVQGADQVVDTCGTGGDGANTFNVSTTAAFIAAGAGVKIAKHGNRAMSSKSGSADVLEALGIKVELSPEQVQECIDKTGIGFMFAPAFHPSMKYASAPRREIGIRTIFNILGPLTNPAGASAQVIGIPREQYGPKVVKALSLLGAKHCVVVHSLDGLDEISITAPTRIWEYYNGEIRDYYIRPEDFGYTKALLRDVQGGTATFNADVLRGVLCGKRGPYRDMAVMNAAAAIWVSHGSCHGGVKAIVDCAARAEAAIDTGAARDKMEQLVRLTRSF